MAIIGDIRKRSGLLVGAIALSIVLFLLGDAVNNQFGVLKGGRSNDAGKVNGEAISYQDYSTQLNENIKNVETQQKASLNDMMRNNLSQQTWDDMVNKIIMDNACAKTGLTVSDDEMVSLTTSDNPHQIIRQVFGAQYSPQNIRQFLQNLDVDDKNFEPGYKRKFWVKIEKEIKKSQMQLKYETLVTKGMGNVPTWMAENAYYESSRTADIGYVMLAYNEVNDNDIKYTDNDLKDYLGKNAARFTAQDERRNIRFVTFDILPSSVDSAAALKSLTDKVEDFKKGEKKSDDSLFVKGNSETAFEDLYKTKEQMMGSPITDSIFNQPVGAIVGPYIDNNMYKFAKVSARKMMSDSVKVREILFSFANVQSEGEQRKKLQLIDSIYKAIDSLHADFGAMAAGYSDDAASKAAGGLVGSVNINDPSKDEMYKTIVFHNGVVGKPYKYLDQQANAIKIIEIVEEHPSKPAVKVAYFSHSILPSAETEKNIYGNATQFAQNNSSEEKFKAYMKANPTGVKQAANITKSSYDVNGMSARSLIKWTFDANRGQVSSIMTLGSALDRKHVITYLESVTGKGTPDLESVKDQVKFFFLQDKKYELLSKKVNDAKAANIEALGAALSKPVQQAPGVSFLNSRLPNGNEPAVAATGVCIAQNKLSGPIKGNMGVYIVQKMNSVEPPKPTDLTQQKMMLGQMAAMRARSMSEALKKLAKIDDNRLSFEGGN
jgi:peptidyl-prolyl cis-trans isomerase D